MAVEEALAYNMTALAAATTAEAAISMLAFFTVYSSFGALTRTMFGIYKAFRDASPLTTHIKLHRKRILVEIGASMFFGTFSALVLAELGAFDYSQVLAAVLGGFLGADLVGLITKKVGLTKGMQVIVTKEQMDLLGLNPRQQKALRYLQQHGTLTNDIYQELTHASHRSATNDLNGLLRKKKLERHGKTRGTYYTPKR